MFNFSRVKIRNRLMLAFGVILLILIGLVGVGVERVQTIDSRLYNINQVNGVLMRNAINYRGSVHDRAIALRDIAIVGDDRRVDNLVDLHDELAENYAEASAAMQEMRATFPDAFGDREDALLNDIQAVAERGREVAQTVIAERRDGNFDQARDLISGEGGDVFANWLDAINAFIDYQETATTRDANVAQAVASGFTMLMVVLAVIALFIGFGLAFTMSRQLVRELGAEPRDVRAYAQAIGEGNLSYQPDVVVDRDSGSIIAAQLRMVEHLSDLISRVRYSAESVASNSKQIAESNSDLSISMEEQASSLAETASAMDELNSTVEQNTDNSRQASEEADGASAVAKRGGQSVYQVTETMKVLNKSSQEIASITSTIDSIAFQTNILALNASVEAARAGEHGRGFAVVAHEVRKLAQRSADAAREIKDLISDNLERVKHGDSQAVEASQATEEIVSAIERVNSLMQEIRHASEEQNTGVSEVNKAINGMDQVTQRNTLSIQEGAQSANHLQSQAQELMEAVSVFQLEDSDRPKSLAAPSDNV